MSEQKNEPRDQVQELLDRAHKHALVEEPIERSEPIMDLPPVLAISPIKHAKNLEGEQEILHIGYQFVQEIKVKTAQGNIDSHKLTHAQALWLLANEPNVFRQYIIRGYYPVGDPYWQGVDPATGQLSS